MTTWNPTYIDGPISIPIFGESDPETGERSIAGYRDGYHLNVARSILTPAMEPYEVMPDPATPVRIWAGDTRGEDGCWRETAFLRFESEGEAVAAMGEWLSNPD